MKKRLLITSIVMMLVVAVALSTATYAWFTSSNSVTANSITMSAATNENSAIEIAYTNTESEQNWLTEINAVSPSGGFKPAAPSVFTIGSTYYSDIVWGSSDVINNAFISADAVGGKQYVWTDVDNQEHQSFYLHNGSTANPIAGITMSATIQGEAASFIRIGVFKKDSTGYKLIGVISNLDNFVKATGYEAGTEYYNSTAHNATALNIDWAAANTDSVEGISAAEWAAVVTANGGMLYKKTVTVVEATAYEQGVTYYTDAAGTIEATEITSAETFASVKASNSNKLYMIPGDATVTVGAITAGKLVSAMTTPAICTKTVEVGALAVNDKATSGDDEMELKIAVWMDGSALSDDTAGNGETGKTATISLRFDARR